MYTHLNVLEERSLARRRAAHKQKIQMQRLGKNWLKDRGRSADGHQRLFLLLAVAVLILKLLAAALLAAPKQIRKEAPFLRRLGARR